MKTSTLLSQKKIQSNQGPENKTSVLTTTYKGATSVLQGVFKDKQHNIFIPNGSDFYNIKISVLLLAAVLVHGVKIEAEARLENNSNIYGQSYLLSTYYVCYDFCILQFEIYLFTLMNF